MKILSCLGMFFTAFAFTLQADVLEVTEANYSSVIEQSTQPVVLDVYATWCPPCRKMAPLLEQVSERYSNVQFLKIDFDASPNVAKRYSVSQLPTLLFFVPGKEDPVFRSTGLPSEKALSEKIEKLTKTASNSY